MAKKARAAATDPALPCPGCQRLEDELARSEQRSYERLREISTVVAGLQERREAALQRLRALQERLDQG
ncbi:MAG: hypothetical protein ACKOZW_01385 [Cyanobium sp.]